MFRQTAHQAQALSVACLFYAWNVIDMLMMDYIAILPPFRQIFNPLL